MESLSVLHVIAGMNPRMGGVSQAVQTIIVGLDKLNIYNEVVSLDDPHALYLSGHSPIIHALGPGKNAWCYNKKLIPWLLENLERFDTLLLHGLWLYPGYATTRAISLLQRREKKTPQFFVMPHGMLDPYFQKAHGRKLKAIRNWIYWKTIENKLIQQADGLLFTSETEKSLAGKTFRPYRPQKEFVVGLGVETPPSCVKVTKVDFSSRSFTPSSEPYLLYLSRIHKKRELIF